MTTTPAPARKPRGPKAPAVPAPGTVKITLQLQQQLAAQGLRRCAGFARLGHASHDAPIDAFNLNAARLLGRARLCKEARKAYTAEQAAARKAAAAAPAYSVVPDPGAKGRWAVHSTYHGELIATGLTKRSAAAEVASLQQQDAAAGGNQWTAPAV